MAWLISDWHTSIPSPWCELLLIAVAIICGGIIGAEREKKEKPAGLRPLMLVSLGSTVFTMISFSVDGDKTRIASQILTGIGFLGAGTILRGGFGIQGITTAATIWVMAATGMLAGLGYAIPAVALSVVILGILSIVHSFEIRYFSCRFTPVTLVFDPAGGKTLVRIEEILSDHGIPLNEIQFEKTPDSFAALHLKYCHVHKRHRELLVEIAALPEVREIKREELNSLR